LLSLVFIIYNYRFLSFGLIKNPIYSSIVIAATIIHAFFINRWLISFMLYLDEGRTPLGWTFNYTWFTLLIFGVLLVVSDELVGKKFQKNRSLNIPKSF